MVIDTSALLAITFNEKRGPWCLDKMQENTKALRMSTVNLAEAFILIQSKQPQLYSEIFAKILSSSIRFVPPSVKQAEIAASARIRYPLNLGDCFAYALAKDEGCTLLSLDTDFKKTDISVICP